MSRLLELLLPPEPIGNAKVYVPHDFNAGPCMAISVFKEVLGVKMGMKWESHNRDRWTGKSTGEEEMQNLE